MTSHRDVVPLLGAWAVGACSQEEAALVEAHLAECAECARESRLVSGSTDHLPEAPTPGRLSSSRIPRPATSSQTPGSPGGPPSPNDAETQGSGGRGSGGLRARVLGAAFGRRPPAPPVPAFAAAYAAQISVLDVLLAELNERDWATRVIYDWNVQDVVAHLSATDRLLTDQLTTGSPTAGSPDAESLNPVPRAAVPRTTTPRATGFRNGGSGDAAGPNDAATRDAGLRGDGTRGDGTRGAGSRDPGSQGAGAREVWDVDAYTASAIAYERSRRPEETRAGWHRQARRLCARLDGVDAGRKVVMRVPMRLDSAMVARAFETWVHSTDIAKAVGLNPPDPLPEHLHAIAGLGVRALPLALSSRGPRSEGLARIVLDGPGGGDWLVTLGGDGAAAPVVTLRMDTLEFCMLAADRRDPSKVAASISGDLDVGRRLLESVAAFAGP